MLLSAVCESLARSDAGLMQEIVAVATQRAGAVSPARFLSGGSVNFNTAWAGDPADIQVGSLSFRDIEPT